MFVITADQVDSRAHVDLVADALERLNAEHRLTLPAERTAGDELQLVTADAATALTITLDLTRTQHWRVGCGIGGVAAPLPASTRAASGPAFIAAREGVDLAKRRGGRAVIVGSDTDRSPTSADLQAVLELLLAVRERRSDEGWELHDLLRSGLTQAQAAERLGISPQAASRRAQVASLRAESAATDALARLMGAHDAAATGTATIQED